MNQYLYKTLPYDPINDFVPITTDGQIDVAPCACRRRWPGIVSGIDRARQGRSRKAQLRRRHHHRTARGPAVQQGGRDRRRLCAVQGHRRNCAGSAHRHVDMVYAATVVAGPLIESGKVRALAKLDSRKEPYPDLPTLAAAGDLQNLTTFRCGSAWSRRKARRSRSSTSSTARSCTFLSEPDVQHKFDQTGNFAVTSTPEDSRHSSARRRLAGPRC